MLPKTLALQNRVNSKLCFIWYFSCLMFRFSCGLEWKFFCSCNILFLWASALNSSSITSVATPFVHLSSKQLARLFASLVPGCIITHLHSLSARFVSPWVTADVQRQLRKCAVVKLNLGFFNQSQWGTQLLVEFGQEIMSKIFGVFCIKYDHHS